jgi:predicted  nucleic acid-binding Zn-ribbon protein
MDENKIFELLEKIYVEVQSHGKRLDNIDDKFNSIDKTFGSLENEIRKIGLKIDEEIIPTQQSLLDGYKQNAEHINAIEDKIDNMQMDINTLTMKVSYNDNRIIEISKNIKKAR